MNLLLLGTSHAHLRFLATLAQHPLVGVAVTLVTTHTQHVAAQQLADIAAGQATLEQCAVPLAPLLHHSGVRWLTQPVDALDLAQRSLRLHDGHVLHFNQLSLAEPWVQDRAAVEARLPGARAHGLFVQPHDLFAELWPRVQGLGTSRKLRVAVLGANKLGVELALALPASLPGAAITLVAGDEPLGADVPAPLTMRLQALLKARNITLLREPAVTLRADEVQLASGARLACDVPLLAGLAQPPAWLAHSGIAMGEQGQVLVDAQRRSTSHPQVWVHSDQDEPTPRAVQALAANLRAVVEGTPLQAVPGTPAKLRFATTGARQAVVGWGSWSAHGQWVWRWKRRQQRQLQQAGATWALPAPQPK
jgi:selenide,water dikinase